MLKRWREKGKRGTFGGNLKFSEIIFRWYAERRHSCDARVKVPALPTSYKIVKAQTGRRRRQRRRWRPRIEDDGERSKGGRLVVKQLAHTGDSPPVTNSTWIHTRHVRQIQTSLMLDEKNEWDFRCVASSLAQKTRLLDPRTTERFACRTDSSD